MRIRGSQLLVAIATSATLVACTSSPADKSGAPGDDESQQEAASAVLAEPELVAVAEGDTPQAIASSVSAALFTSAPVALVASAGAREAEQAAAEAAESLGVPLLLDEPVPVAPTDTPTPGATPATGATPAPAAAPAPGPLADEISRLGAESVLAVGSFAPGLEQRVSGVELITATAEAASVQEALGNLPETTPPAAGTDTTVLVRTDGVPAAEAPAPDAPPAVLAASAVSATARAAGAEVVAVSSDDPRTDSDAIKTLAARTGSPVLGAGPGFGPVERLGTRVATAETGVELPGGGQTMFPGRALVALYGHPGTASLGVLGEQDAQASVARAKEVAAPYIPVYGDVPVIPTFEVIATIASGSAGADGDYANESDIELLRPYVDAATEAGMYVVLDLQPGRADLIAQAEIYRELLTRPNVGLAIDPEWALEPNQLPLQQIGAVTAEEINAVTDWLAKLTADASLPQKVLVVHQFKLSSIKDEERINTSSDEVAVLVHADGQGGRSQKEDTWGAIVGTTPPGIWYGWKNFYDEDPEIASPADSVNREPKPLMISYQ